MHHSFVFPKVRKLAFTNKIMAIIFTVMVLLIAADSFVQAITPDAGKIQSGNQYNFNVAQSYKISNSIMKFLVLRAPQYLIKNQLILIPEI